MTQLFFSSEHTTRVIVNLLISFEQTGGLFTSLTSFMHAVTLNKNYIKYKIAHLNYITSRNIIELQNICTTGYHKTC